MVSPSGYNIADYGDMVDCEPRMSRYAEALKQAITPGCTVIDIGAGFGIFSLLACKYGAGKVIAIEPDPSIQLLGKLAQANGCGDRISAIQGLSSEYTPDPKADVIISDLRGNLPLFEGHIETIIDARERLLAPAGKLLPMRDTIMAALVCSPKSYRLCQRPWSANSYELDLSAGQTYAVNKSSKVYLDESTLLSKPAELASLDYRTIASPNMDGMVSLAATRDATAHGLLVWFDAEIDEGLGYSNAPGEPELVYHQRFFPFERPVEMCAGDHVEARLRAALIDDSYVWTWNSEVFRENKAQPAYSFRQSTFKGRILSPQKDDVLPTSFIPNVSRSMTLDRDCLDMVDGKRSVDDIAAELMNRYPEQLTTHQQAVRKVTRLIMGYRQSAS